MAFEKEEVPYLLTGKDKWVSWPVGQFLHQKNKMVKEDKKEVCKLLRRDKNV